MATSGFSPSSRFEVEFHVKGKSCNVVLTSTDIGWKLVNKDKEETVPISQIISSRLDNSGKGCGWVLSYAARKKGCILKKCEVVFKGAEDQCTQMLTRIQEGLKILADRPKSILVFVNPISGSSKGRQTFTRKVRPLLEEAGIKLDVCVTERAHHTEEILSTYDLTSIDSIVAVGGDGIYHEVVNGMLQRLSKDASVDVNDPTADLPQITHTIGLIPCGTGNGIAYANYGNYDVETAALAIMIGKSNITNVFSVFSDGALLAFSILLVGYGFWGDIIYATENHRHLGIWRYPLIIGEFVFSNVRQMQLSIEYLSPVESGPAMEAGTSSDAGKDADQSVSVSSETQVESTHQSGQEWQKLHGMFTGIIGLGVMDTAFGSDKESSLGLNCTRLFANKPCGKFKMMSFMMKLMTYNESINREENVVSLQAREFRIKLMDNPADEETDLRRKQHGINLDGEFFHLKHPEIYAKLHLRKLRLFANVPLDWFSRPKNQRTLE